MRVERVAKGHDRSGFDCGQPALNSWLAREARQYEKKNTARTFILTPDSRTVVGYFSLSTHSVVVPDVPTAMQRGLKQDHTLPAVLLGKLAIAKSHQGQGLGKQLLAQATRTILRAALEVGIHIVVIDAIDEDAAAFYEKYGFVRWPAERLRLFAKVSDLAVTFAEGR